MKAKSVCFSFGVRRSVAAFFLLFLDVCLALNPSISARICGKTMESGVKPPHSKGKTKERRRQQTAALQGKTKEKQTLLAFISVIAILEVSPEVRSSLGGGGGCFGGNR